MAIRPKIHHALNQHRELHLASAGSGSPIEPAINPTQATASAMAIAKMDLRMIGSLKLVGDRSRSAGSSN
jgi:hypothetical protein